MSQLSLRGDSLKKFLQGIASFELFDEPQLKSILQAAKHYAQQGLAVLWIRGASGGPEQGRGKAPIERNWQHSPHTMPSLVESSYCHAVIECKRRNYPISLLNLGIRTGIVDGTQQAVVVIDLDSPTTIAQAHEKLPFTSWRVRTYQGEHWYYRHPGPQYHIDNRVSIQGYPVDIRADGGVIVTPPSIHPSGFQYQFIGNEVSSVDKIPIFSPEWFPKTENNSKHVSASKRQQVGNVTDRARKWLATVDGAISGQGGHKQTYKATLGLVKGFSLPPQEAMDLLLAEYNPRCQPPWSEKELWHKVLSARQSHVPDRYLLDVERPQR